MTMHALRQGEKCVSRCGETTESVTTDKTKVDCWRCIHILFERPLPASPNLPEHDKLRAAKKTSDATQLIGDFLDWLREQGLLLAEDQPASRFSCEHCGVVPADEVFFVDWSSADEALWRHKRKNCKTGVEFEHRGGGHVHHDPAGLYPSGRSREKLLAEFFKIDTSRLESEKRALLEEQRAINNAVEWAAGEGRRQLQAL